MRFPLRMIPCTRSVCWRVIDADGRHISLSGNQETQAELIERANDATRLAEIVRRVAEHFSDTDAPLGIDARAALTTAGVKS